MTPSIRGCDLAMRPILEVRDLSIHAGSDAQPIPLVEEVSFSVAKGSTLAVVGEVRLRKIDDCVVVDADTS